MKRVGDTSEQTIAAALPRAQHSLLLRAVRTYNVCLHHHQLYFCRIADTVRALYTLCIPCKYVCMRTVRASPNEGLVGACAHTTHEQPIYGLSYITSRHVILNLILSIYKDGGPIQGHARLCMHSHPSVGLFINDSICACVVQVLMGRSIP